MGLLRSVLALCLGFVVVCLVVVPPAVAKFVVEKNSLTVVSPESIKGTHDSAIGNFGIPQYGGSMAGTVVYPKENTKGCKGFDEYGISFKSKIGALPTFVVVDRGGTHVSYWTNLLVFGVFRFLIVCFDWLWNTLFVNLSFVCSLCWDFDWFTLVDWGGTLYHFLLVLICLLLAIYVGWLPKPFS